MVRSFLLGLFLCASFSSFSQTESSNKNKKWYENRSQLFGDFVPVRFSEEDEEVGDFGIFMAQLRYRYDLLPKARGISFGPYATMRFSAAFVIYIASSQGVRIGVNDKGQTSFPIGINANFGTDFTTVFYGNSKPHTLWSLTSDYYLSYYFKNLDGFMALGFTRAFPMRHLNVKITSFSIGSGYNF